MKTFGNRRSLNSHDKYVHESKKDYQCHNCGKYFGQKKELQKHVKSHEKVNNYFCDKCKKGYGFKNLLTMHMKNSICQKSQNVSLAKTQDHIENFSGENEEKVENDFSYYDQNMPENDFENEQMSTKEMKNIKFQSNYQQQNMKSETETLQKKEVYA